ncbi:hypothetical protein M422DRAFT_166273 [Sphaerobolus stellatus SS14]|uniref:CHCH domain-containing protein n=1 Tax=Sphaerobolus stellatus (strain SS14) TaxID=990650 RepID=A0A0C9W3A4_SPHS4|nr:hypothetical protein M422DRAFT_166273 [Sphaerobolus stellatus SS14]
MSFGRPPSFSSFKPSAPDRGSFPLDHDGECKTKMMDYMTCLQKNANNSEPCRLQSKEYLECRMNRGLMQQEEWKNLGLGDVAQNANASSCTTCSRDKIPK